MKLVNESIHVILTKNNKQYYTIVDNEYNQMPLDDQLRRFVIEKQQNGIIEKQQNSIDRLFYGTTNEPAVFSAFTS